MITVNLIPYRERERRLADRRFWLCTAAAAAGGLLFAAAGTVVLGLLLANQLRELEDLGRRTEALRTEAVRLEPLAVEAAQLEQRARLVELFAGRQAAMMALVNELPRRLPPGVGLDTLRQEGERLTLAGQAPSHRLVAAFVEELAVGAVFDSVRLVETRRADEGGAPVEFVLEARLANWPVPAAVAQ